jgi:antitoxin MazE
MIEITLCILGIYEGAVMQTTIQRWGNSSAVRIPKPLLSEVALKENDSVELAVVGSDILIRKATVGFVHRTLAQRLRDVRPADERLRDVRPADVYQADEYDPSAVGGEVFW